MTRKRRSHGRSGTRAGVALAGGVLLMLFLAACSGGTPTEIGDPISFPRLIADEVGFTIRQETAPQRIASVDQPFDEILLDLVGPERMVTVSYRTVAPSSSDLAEEAQQVQISITQDIDALMAQDPDLAVLPTWTGPMRIAHLRDARVPSFYLDTPTSFETIKEKIRYIAYAVAEPETGDELIRVMNQRIAEVEADARLIPAEQRTSVIYYDPVSLRARGEGTIFAEMVEAAGLINVLAGVETSQYGEVYTTLEDLATLDPDIILLPGRVSDSVEKAQEYFQEFMNAPETQSLTAMRTGNVIMANEAHVSSESHYAALGARDLFEIAYGER